MMYTYNVKQGDVAKFPNGVEVNYDAITEALVVKANPGTTTPQIRAIPESPGYFLVWFE